MTSKRDKICAEILQVESNYVQALRTLEQDIRVPVMERFGHKTHLKLNSIFGNTKIILDLNQSLLLDLQEADNDSIGGVFLKFAPYLKMYTAYLNHTEQALELIQVAKKKSNKFRAFCKDQTQTVESLLIRPVQQIPRYVMLLKELLKNTPHGHPDRDDISNAIVQCEAVASHCNQSITKRKRFMETLEVNERFAGQKLKDSNTRLILKEGELDKVNRRGVAENRVFILFTDALAYGTGTKGEDVKLHRIMYMGDFGVFESKDSSASFEVRSKSRGTFGRAKAFVVRANSETEKKGWLNSITGAIKDAGVDSKSQQFAAMWSHDTKECEVCDQSFGLIRRRHHCRNCGKCVCNSCSPNQWTLEHVSSKPQRVCNMCYVRLKTALREKKESQRVIIGENSTVDMLDSLQSFTSTKSDVSTSLSQFGSVESEDDDQSSVESGRRPSSRPPSLQNSRPPSFQNTRPPSFKNKRVSRPKSSGPPPLPKKKAPPLPSKRRKPKSIQKKISKPKIKAPPRIAIKSKNGGRKDSLEALRSRSMVSSISAQLNKGKKARSAPQRNRRRTPKPRRRPSAAVMKAAVRSEARRLSQVTGSDTKSIMKRLSKCLSPSAMSSDDDDEYE